jgi:hypothetical protein
LSQSNIDGTLVPDEMVTCGELRTVLSTRLDCRLPMSSPTKTWIDTATAMPQVISAVCPRFDRRKRMAILRVNKIFIKICLKSIVYGRNIQYPDYRESRTYFTYA